MPVFKTYTGAVTKWQMQQLVSLVMNVPASSGGSQLAQGWWGTERGRGAFFRSLQLLSESEEKTPVQADREWMQLATEFPLRRRNQAESIWFWFRAWISDQPLSSCVTLDKWLDLFEIQVLCKMGVLTLILGALLWRLEKTHGKCAVGPGHPISITIRRWRL